MAREERGETLNHLHEAEESVIRAFLPQDEADNVTTALVEIRAGAGGEEASLFVVDMTRLYEQFVARQPDWRLKTISWTEDFSQPKGAKEVVLQVTGTDVYRLLKYESGVHRVQRVPATETQGRVHTSTVTVAVLPQYDQVKMHCSVDRLMVALEQGLGRLCPRGKGPQIRSLPSQWRGWAACEHDRFSGTRLPFTDKHGRFCANRALPTSSSLFEWFSSLNRY